MKKTNIVLIGMPCAGKTTIGRMLSERTGMPHVDTDAEIVKNAGMPITEIFRDYGEKTFRDMETREVRAAAKEADGRVISTGGGAVLREENVQALKKTGLLIFLDRPLEKLMPAEDRPLSGDREKLEKMYIVRYPIYRAAADVRIPADGTPEEVLEKVLAAAGGPKAQERTA